MTNGESLPPTEKTPTGPLPPPSAWTATGLRVLGVSLAVGVLVSLDAWMAYTYRPTSAWVEWSGRVSELGSGEAAFLVGGLALVWACLRRDDRLGRWALSFLVGVAAAGATTFALKSLIGRVRPYAMDGPWEFLWFHPFTIAGAWQSFPSGHATVTGVAVETVRRWYPRVRWVRWGVGLTAVVVGLTRVTGRFHHPSDVVVGYVIGVWVARWVMDVLARRTFRLPGSSRDLDAQASDVSEVGPDATGQASDSGVSETGADSPRK